MAASKPGPSQQHSHDKLTKSLENAHRLLDVKAAIEQVREKLPTILFY
jgi:hypothetical protein